MVAPAPMQPYVRILRSHITTWAHRNVTCVSPAPEQCQNLFPLRPSISLVLLKLSKARSTDSKARAYTNCTFRKSISFATTATPSVYVQPGMTTSKLRLLNATPKVAVQAARVVTIMTVVASERGIAIGTEIEIGTAADAAAVAVTIDTTATGQSIGHSWLTLLTSSFVASLVYFNSAGEQAEALANTLRYPFMQCRRGDDRNRSSSKSSR